MIQYVLDTDTLSRFWRGEQAVTSRIMAAAPDAMAVTVITVEETLSGWQKLLRRAKNDGQVSYAYDAMASTVRMLGTFEVLSYSEIAIARYRSLLSQKVNVRGNDLRIAAIALEHAATAVTRNLRDFSRIPGLNVENWCD